LITCKRGTGVWPVIILWRPVEEQSMPPSRHHYSFKALQTALAVWRQSSQLILGALSHRLDEFRLRQSIGREFVVAEDPQVRVGLFLIRLFSERGWAGLAQEAGS